VYLTRTNDDVVNWNENELNEKANESHDNETDGSADSNLREFCNTKCTMKLKIHRTEIQIKEE